MGFFDLNIPYHESDRHAADKSSLRGRRLKLALKAMELGYTGIAYNRTFKGIMSESDRCATPLFPITKLTPSSSSFFASVKFHRELLSIAVSSPFRQYTRLTVIVDIPSQVSGLNAGNPILRSYDVVAVRPMNQNAFDQACQTSEVDIIAIDFSEKLPFRLKQPMVRAAIKRGVYFEITYYGLIADAQARREMISNCKILVDWTRGKNLILCSAAPSTTELRGPQDVANLFSLLGLSRERAKAAISKNCRSLLANALKKRHFFKEAVKVEQIPSAGQVNQAQAFDDWLKWDPISSGDGDLLLDDMEKSFSISKTVKENVKNINFTSSMNGLPVHGLQIKDLICVTKAAFDPQDADNHALAEMETERDDAVGNPEEQGGLNPLLEEQSHVPENQCSLSNLSEDQAGVNLLPAGLVSSSGPANVHLASGSQDSEVSVHHIPELLLAVQPLTEDGQACLDDAKIGHQISEFEEDTEISDEKPKCSKGLKTDHSDVLEGRLVTYETKSQDIPSPVHGGNALHDGGVHFTNNSKPVTNNHVSVGLSNALVISKSTSATFPLESTVKNQFAVDVRAHEGAAMDKVPDKIDTENMQLKPLALYDSLSHNIYMEGGQSSTTAHGSLKLGDGLPIEGFLHPTTDSSKLIKDLTMGEQEQIESVTDYQSFAKPQAGRQRRKRSLPHQPLLPPFTRFLKPRPFKRKSRKHKVIN